MTYSLAIAATLLATHGFVSDPLRSSNDTGPKKAVIVFVEQVAQAGSPQFGRRPIAAFGDSDGDLQMLQWTSAGAGPRFCLYVHHSDAEREYAYDRDSHIGKLDKGLDEAHSKGWTVLNMKEDWGKVHP